MRSTLFLTLWLSTFSKTVLQGFAFLIVPNINQRSWSVGSVVGRSLAKEDQCSGGHQSEGQQPDRTPDAVLEERTREFTALVDEVASVKDPNHAPSVLTKNLQLVLDVLSNGPQAAKIVQKILDDVSHDHGERAAEKVTETIDVIFSFAETFVDEAFHLQTSNKHLLGEIIKSMSDKTLSEREREEELDDVMKSGGITAGFLRHLDYEIERISSAPRISKEGYRLLEMIRVIQARVVEELGNDLGEAAKVLGQLVAYEEESECLAVLDAGLTVRGVAFAKEMYSLTKEALEGFQGIPGGADPSLVKRVQTINKRLCEYLEVAENSFE